MPRFMPRRINISESKRVKTGIILLNFLLISRLIRLAEIEARNIKGSVPSPKAAINRADFTGLAILTAPAKAI
jgi:hypothetical protein